MPDDLKISAMTPITGANIAADDVIPVVDVSTSTNRNITRDEYLSEVKRVIFSRTNYDAAPEEGVLTWDADEKTLSLGLNGGDTVLQIGQESHIRVRNNSGALIANGTVVMQVGTIGNSGRLTIAKAVADGSVDGHRILGITTEDIANGADGLVTNFGKVRQINTTAFADGAVLYANPAVPGGMTATRPAHPNAVVVVAFVVHSHSSGTLFVHPSYESQPEMVTLTGTQTLTNKTINLASNTLVATSAQLRAALTDETGTGAAVFAGSPALTGTPTAPTAAQGTNTTQVATTEFVTDTGVTLTRAQLVTRCASGWRAVAGQILWADGVAYVGSAGATAISDLPGLLPAINVTYAHFGAAGIGGNDTTAIDAAHAYLTTMWATSPGAAGVPVGALPLHIPVGRWRSSAGRVYTVPGTGFTVTGDGPAAQLDQVDFALGGHSRCSFSDFSMRGATAIGLNLTSGSGVNTAKGFYRNIYIRDKTTAGISLNGAQHNKFVSCFVEECGIGLQFLGGAGNNVTNCDFQQCVTYGVDIRSNGELRMNSCRARGAGFGSVAAGGWANLNVYTTGDPILEHYFVDCSFSGAQYGGRRYAIASIADNGSGKIRVTTSVPHELAPGLIDVQLNGTAAYDDGGAIAGVLDVISPTVFDMDRAYTAPAGAVGNVWLEGWDIQMVNAGGLGDINDMFFTGGNANYVKLDGVYNFVSNGRIPKQQLWLTDNAANNQIYLQRSARGRSAQTQRDVIPSGPGSYRGWGETIFGRDNPTSFAVDGGERVAMRMPNTAAGVAANNLPAAINESAVMADGLRWRVNGKEATIKEAGGVLTIAGVSGVVPTGRATYGGTANAITLTTGANLSGTIPTGMELRFRATSANTGATTIAVDGGSAIACRTRTGVALPAGYIRTDVDTIARFDGTYLVLSREVEQGSNANGEYTRHADGSQTCWTKLVIKPAADATTGIKSATWTFPAAFVSGSTKTVVTHAIQTTNPIQRGQVAVNACTNTDVALLYNEGAGTAVDVTTHATATGRWF